MDDKILKLQNLIDNSKYTVVITGEGVSIASGINDFAHADLLAVMQMSSKFVLKHMQNKYYKAVWKTFLNPIFNTGPNITHKKLAQLEKENKIQGIITTNIDHLHSLAGSKNVAEICGSFAYNKCLKCKKEYNDINIWNNGETPKCECGGVIAPFPVYSYVGEISDEVEKARSWVENAELIIIIGENKAHFWSYGYHINKNAKMVQINPKITYFDNKTILNIHKKPDEIFNEISK